MPNLRMAAILALGVIQENECIARINLITLRVKAFELSEKEFIENFWLTKRLTQILINEIQQYLEQKTPRANAFSAETKACNIFISSIFDSQCKR